MKTAPGQEKLFFPTRDVLPQPPAPSFAAWLQGRHWSPAIVALSGIVVIGFCIAFVDRPLATMMHDARHGHSLKSVAVWATEPVLPAAALLLGLVAVTAAVTRKPSSWTRTLIACSLAIMVAVVLKDQLKFVFGRTWPESGTRSVPSWIGTGAFGFHPFHGGSSWASFPSGHTAAVTAGAAVLWQRARNLRWLWASVVVSVVFALLGGDFHFASDIIAGFYLGLGSAAVVLALFA